MMAASLNRRLPARFVADAPVSLGSKASADVAEIEPCESGNGADAPGGAATALQTYAPPATDLFMPATFPDEIKVEVRDANDDFKVLAVIELVSEGNKKEEGERERFAAKCLSYLGAGLGLVVVDVVTTHRFNLHNELVRIAEHDDKFRMPDGCWIYATAYRPVSRGGTDLIELRPWPLTVGAALPEVPLALKGYGCVRLDLEATYLEACQNLRIPE
jgi:hypothetical protein